MIRTVLLLSSIFGLVRSSGVHGDGLAHFGHVAAIGPAPVAAPAPVVTAASSQYFQRTFNRLIVPQVVAPVAPVAPPPLQPVFPVGPAPTVFVEPTRAVPVAVNPPPTQAAPVNPNVAIAVATAHAAAPVATILLPPYPFGFPPNFGFIPQEQPINVPDGSNKEPTTQSTTQAEVTTTQEPEQTTPVPSSSDDNFAQQPQPSNQDVNFNQYEEQFPPYQPLPQQPQGQPQPQQPRPQFQGQQPQGQFQPQQPRPQFQGQQPQGQFPQQQPRPQYPQQQPHPQFQPQQPQFPLQRPQGQFPPHQGQPQFPQQSRPQHQPVPQAQQSRPQFQPAPQPQQPRPQYQPSPQPQQPQAWTQQPRPVYQAPQQSWPQQRARPQKLKTSVEVVLVPLAYITPPPLQKTHAHVKVVKHVYAFVPAGHAKIILRPVKTRTVRLVKKVRKVHPQNLRANARDIEVTTVSPFPRPNTKPPKV